MAWTALPEWATTMPEPGSRGGDAAWQQVRSPVAAPLLRLAVSLCLAMSAMLLAEKAYMAAAVLAARLLGRRPERQYRWEPIRDDDLEAAGGAGGGGAAFPMVLVQIPMYNEREVSIGDRSAIELAEQHAHGRLYFSFVF